MHSAASGHLVQPETKGSASRKCARVLIWRHVQVAAHALAGKCVRLIDEVPGAPGIMWETLFSEGLCHVLFAVRNPSLVAPAHKYLCMRAGANKNCHVSILSCLLAERPSQLPWHHGRFACDLCAHQRWAAPPVSTHV